MSGSHFSSGGRYPVLRSLAILYLLGAVVTVIGGVAFAVWIAVKAPDSVDHRLGLALIALAGTFFLTISMLAVAEVLKLFIDIERNSRGAHLAGIGSMGEMRADGSRSEAASQWLHGEETAEGALIRGH